MANMGLVTEYLKSKQMSQDLAEIDSEKLNNLEYLNKEMTCALLRWQQWFENPQVDRKAVKLSVPTQTDFDEYRRTILQILSQVDISENTIQPLINQALVKAGKSLIEHGPDFQDRFVQLIAMGACEYYGFNGHYTNSIKQHGINPKFEKKNEFEPIYQILKRVGASTQLGRFKHDEKIYLTNDPRVAYLHSSISPKWFCYFNEDMLMPYLNQDYPSACQKLFNFRGNEKLTHEDCLKIREFFDKWWHRLVTPDNQKIAVVPMYRTQKDLQNRINLNQFLLKKQGFKAVLNASMSTYYERPYQEPIAPESIINIVDVPSFTSHIYNLTKAQATKGVHQHLSHLQNVFQVNALKRNQKKQIKPDDHTQN